MNVNQLERVGTDSNEFGSEVIIYRNEYDEITENCKNSTDFVLELLRDEIYKDEKLKEYSDKFNFSRIFNNSTVGVSAHITIDIIDFKEEVLPPLTLNYFGTFFMQSLNEKHMNELSDKIGRRFTLRMHRNMFKDNITIALVSYNPYLVRQGAVKDNSFDVYEYLKKTRGEESLKYEDFNDIGNERFTSDGTEALKEIVKKVAKKAADKAGILPAGTINVNKKNIKGFAKACDVLQNYGQSRELINRSFKGINVNMFGNKRNLDMFMNSLKPVGKYHVAQGWLIFELMETDTYKLKNELDKESWDSMYDAAGIVTKKANYITTKIIKELFGSREIELHPNPIGHLLSKSSTKARLMFKLGKLNNVEDGTYSGKELVDKIRTSIGVESFEFNINIFDMSELEYGIEEILNDYNFFESIGIESDMISIAEAFGEIEDLNEMIAIESSPSVTKTDYTKDIINEILNRMEQDPILKLAKDKELIEIKTNSKKRVSINFKEIKDIEKILTPEDIQKYGGSTYQFLLKLSDTFNKNIMWKMKEIEEAARSGGSDSSLDAEATESLRGREYFLAVGIETVDDILNEILAEDGTEGFDEFKESARVWVKKMIAKIIDFLGKERWIFRAQVKTYNKIKAKINTIGKENYQNYDLGNIKGAISTLAFINKKKYLFYRGLNNINFENIESVKGSMEYLNSAKEDLRTAIDKLQETASKIKSGNYSYRDPKMGDLNTIKSTMNKVKLEWVDVKQNFLKLEKMINDETIEDETIKNGLKGFLTVSSVLQKEYLKGVNEALNICEELLKNKDSGNEDVEVELFCGNESIGFEDVSIKDQFEDTLISTLAIAGTIGIMVGAKKLWEKTPWGKKQLEAKIKKEIEKQECEKEEANQRLADKLNEEARKLLKDTYNELVNDAVSTVKGISKEVVKKIPRMSEFKAFENEVNKKAKSDEFVKDCKDDILWMSADNIENYDFGISAFDFSQDVYLISAWGGLSKAIINEMNKNTNKIPCKPGFKWVFEYAYDDESCFWCVLRPIGNGGTESIENDVYYEVIGFEDVNDYYKDPGHYKPSFSEALKYLKNGIVAFIKPFTATGRREALKKKQEEQAELERVREENAKKQIQEGRTSELYDQYIRKALPIAKKEAEKIVKMLPNFPQFKNLVKEVAKCGEEHDWKNAVDCISYFVEADADCTDNMTVLIAYDQDLYGFKNHDKLEEIIIKRLNKIADKIPHPGGYKWSFCGPFDDEACIWMLLEDEEQPGTEGFFSNMKDKWNTAVERHKARMEEAKVERTKAYSEKQRVKAKENAYKIVTLSELEKAKQQSIKTAKSIFKEAKDFLKKNKMDYVDFNKPTADGYLNMIDDGKNGAYSWELWIAHVDIDDFKSFEHKGDYDQFIKATNEIINKYKDKLGFELDYWDVDAQTIFIFMKGHYYVESSEETDTISNESEMLKAIHDEYGIEGLTNIIQRIIRK